MKKFISLMILVCLISCSSTEHTVTDIDFDKDLESISEDKKNIVLNSSKSFVDKAELYGLENVKAYNLNVVDLNGDDYSDIVVLPSFYSQPEFYYFNIFEKKFVKGRSPFKESLMASYFLFYDLNNDRILDAIVGVLNQKTEMSNEPLRVYYGKKNKINELTFEKSAHKFDSYPNSTVGLIDFNLDGRLDLFVGNWFTRYKGSPIAHKDFLFQANENKFINKTLLLTGENKQTDAQGMHVNATPTYGAKICDIDQNGYPDILTTSTNSFHNKLWMNMYKFRQGARYFKNVAINSGYAADPDGLLNKQGGGRTFGIACTDYNNDGIFDVFLGELTHNYDNQGVDRSSILTGRTLKSYPRFYRTEYTQDSFDSNWHQADRRALWVDLNNDGLQDLVVDNSGYPPHTKLIVFKQLPDHSFVNISDELGVGIMNPNSTVLIDVNRDGKLDLLTAQTSIRDARIKPKISLFVNELEINNRSLRFYLRGSKSNYHGLNATIILKTKNSQNKVRYQKQFVTYSYGALPPQNEEGINFGIPEGEKVEYVKVIWPYSNKVNTKRASLEKVYRIKNNFSDYMNITLCEGGEFLIGRRECLR